MTTLRAHAWELFDRTVESAPLGGRSVEIGRLDPAGAREWPESAKSRSEIRAGLEFSRCGCLRSR